LWDSDRDRQRAQGLAVGARDAYAHAGDKSKVGDIDAWLAARKAKI
jgi:hypothetical protein